MSELNEASAPTAGEGKKIKKPADAEFVALKRIGSVLNGLSDSAKRRVLSYYVDRAVPC
jgi:hypothetical protein